MITQKKWPEAVIALRELIKEEPAYSEAAIALARALVFSGRREEALGVLARVGELKKGKAKEALSRRARVISRLFLTNATFQIYQDGLNNLVAGKYRNARDQLSRALEQEPDNVEILVRLGQSYQLMGDFDSATERFKLARKLSPTEPEVVLWLARASFLRGETDSALSEMKAIYPEVKSWEMASLWLADMLAARGQQSAALKVLDDDVQANPLHLASLIELCRLRFAASPRDKQNLWAIRKNLQLATSRVPEYPARPLHEQSLSLNLKDASQLKAEVEALTLQIEARLDPATN